MDNGRPFAHTAADSSGRGQSGAGTKKEIYFAVRKQEIAFWGDGSVYLRLDALTVAPEPLLRIAGDRYELTPSGQSLLEGEGVTTLLCTAASTHGSAACTSSGDQADGDGMRRQQKLEPQKSVKKDGR